jgi:hypothetical protein
MKKYTHIPQIMVDLVERSDARLNPAFEVGVDEILGVGNLLLSMNKKDSELTEAEHDWFNLLNFLMIYSLDYEMKHNPQALDNMYQLFNGGGQHKLSDNDEHKGLFEKILVNNLIETEDYEKVIELNKKNKDSKS